MTFLKRTFDFYLQGSIHVALSVYSLIRVTDILLHLKPDYYMAGFGFFGTIVGYNFVKYDAIARSGTPELSVKLKWFIALSAVAFIGTIYCFFHLQWITQIVSGVFLLITALYTLPFFPNRKNARSWAGLKIYIVALCWVGVTFILPVLNAGVPMETDFFIICIKRFILIVVLLFVFEIIDLAWDDPHLKTVPQQIGVKRTKQLGILLLLLFLVLELFQIDESWPRFFINSGLIAITAGFLVFANEQRSKYYTTFWTESIPVLWWLLLLAFGQRL